MTGSQRHLPLRSQRNVARFGTSPTYGWSEDKERQYAENRARGLRNIRYARGSS